MLRIEKRVSLRTCLATVERWVSRANYLANPMFRRRSHPDLAFAARVVLRTLVNFDMPKMVSDQFVFQGAKCVIEIVEISLMNAWEVDELRTAVATRASDDVPLGGLRRLAKTVETIIARCACTRDLKWLQFLWGSVGLCHNYSNSDKA
jgi:hypothetical protein